MRTFSNKLAVLTALAVLGASASAASVRDDICTKGVFNAGVKYDSPPFGFVDENGDVGGFDVDLIKEIGKDLTAVCKKPIKLVLKQVTSSNRIEFVQNGTIDIAAATATATYGRMDTVDFLQHLFHRRPAIARSGGQPDQDGARSGRKAGWHGAGQYQ